MTVEERMDGLESMVHGTTKDHRYASHGVGNAGVALGTVGTALGRSVLRIPTKALTTSQT